MSLDIVYLDNTSAITNLEASFISHSSLDILFEKLNETRDIYLGKRFWKMVSFLGLQTEFLTETLKSFCDWMALTQSIFDWLRAPS